MNKKSKKRAFFVYVAVCLLYVFVTFQLPEKMSMTRTSDGHMPPSKGTVLPLPDTSTAEKVVPPPQRAQSDISVPTALAETVEGMKAPGIDNAPVSLKHEAPPRPGHSWIEPSLLISIPLIAHAMKEGWVERESLIFVGKDAYNNVTWKKPIEILKNHDEEGIRSILNTIGKKRVLEFMKQEGIGLGADLSADDVILGKGYRVEKEKLLDLYKRHVSKEFEELLPFSLNDVGIVKESSGYRLTRGKDGGRENSKVAEAEWMMPNLANLPMRTAVAKLSVHTSHIRIHGNGHVVNQSPRAFERLKGEPECTIQGRTQNE